MTELPLRRVAVIGNPNTGKTTLFNKLTGLALRVGNYPGVTVERKEGRCELPDGGAVTLVDLPGTYSLAARSPDEMIAVDELLGQQAGVAPVSAVVAVLDAANLERNCYLLSQLVEVGLPVVVALNRVDLAASQGVRADAPRLAERLGVAVVPTNARTGDGVDALRAAIGGATAPPATRPVLPEALRAAAEGLAAWCAERRAVLGRAVPGFEALRAVVDVGGHAEARLTAMAGAELAPRLAAARRDAGQGRPPIAVEAPARYAWIRERLDGAVARAAPARGTRTDRLDAVLTHRVAGIVVLLLVLGVVFQSIYAFAGYPMEWLDAAVGWVGAAAGGWLPEGLGRSFVVDAVFGGVGAVVVFVPQIAILFFFLALLEDCGYLARAAFLLDRLLASVGLSGRSVVPLLSSFACAIPGIMAARTIESRRDRLATILVAPLMSCSARFPVYVLLIGAFVPPVAWAGGLVSLQGLTLLAFHLVGVVVAVPVLYVMRRTLFRGPPPPFVMELPPYTWPSWRTVWRRVGDRSWAFLRRAGTLIFAVTVVVWALSVFPRSDVVAAEAARDRRDVEGLQARGAVSEAEAERRLAEIDARAAGEQLRGSLMGRMGRAIEPVVRPLGWDWRIGVAAIASFPAREVVIAQLGTLYHLGGDVDETDAGLRAALRAATWPDGRPVFSLPVALGLMVFFALCAQCGATLVTIRRETGQWRWAVLAFVYMTALAYLGALVTYQVML